MRVIAIDGPAGAGKSTVARMVADQTGMPFLDTGAMYRCIALTVVEDDIDSSDARAVGEIAHSLPIEIDGDIALIGDRNVSSLIRTPQINSIVSVIATHPPVRDAMREQQREWVKRHGGAVVEGRDIGTVVFPDAQLKVFLTASPMVRAQRRVDQSGGDVNEIAASIAERDRIDSTRSDSPLKPADNAFLLDSSEIPVEKVVEVIVRRFREADHG